MPIPTPSHLDAAQCIQGAYSESDGSFRVDAEITANISGPQEVIISDTDDSIKIGNGSGVYLAVNSDGSINVNSVTSSTGTPIAVFNEITGLAMGGSQTVLSYTVPVGKTLSEIKVDVSGDSIGLLELDLNGSTNAKQRLTYSQFNTSFDYQKAGYTLGSGLTLALIATNNSQSGLGSFCATLQGALE